MSSTARQLAERILREYKSGRHYRDIARDDFPDRRADGSQIVKAGTLNRIVKSNGKWTPKNKEILIALGLKEVKTKKLPVAPSQEWWERVAKQGVRVMVKLMKKSVLRQS